jgi:hypothetical protein
LPRLLSTLFVACLIGGTAAAFAVTQGLKLERSPILAPRIDKVFSPVCDCETRVADIEFRLRAPDRVRLEIVRGETVVRELVAGERLRRGTVRYTWNGRDDHGRFVPEGVYRPRVHLDDQRRTIVLPNDMRVDTTPPDSIALAARPRAISPDGDGRGDRVRIAYRFPERAHALLIVDGRRQTFTRRSRPAGSLTWDGRIAGTVVSPGRHLLELYAQDVAGNVGGPTAVPVSVRYVELARRAVRVRPGRRVRLRVAADAAVHWRLGGRTGTAKPGLLVLPAPAKPGRYALVVGVGAHRDRAVVVVRRR